jgi:succinoglycan biosynthesis transport protein ExoP
MQCDCDIERANATGEVMMGDGPSANDLNRPFEDGLSARALLSSIRRHLPIVLAFTLSLCAVGALVGLGLPAWFEAEGEVVIHSRPKRMAELQELPDATPDLFVIQSEVDILKSRSVIEPVVRSFRLWEAPEFQKMEYPKGWSWQIVKERLGDIRRAVWELAGSPEDRSPERPLASTQPGDADAASPAPQAEIDAAVEGYRGYLVVKTDGNSMTIRASYRAWTPDRAAAVVNAHIDSYRNFEIRTKVAAAEHANAALTTQVVELRQQLQAAESAVTRYREEHRLTGAARDSAGVSAQLAALNSQLITARADLAENEVRAARIGAGAGSDSLPEVVASGTISALRGQEAQLTAREADLSKYHGDEYPELRRVRASLQDLRGQISRQIGRDRAAALQVVERSRTRERSLQQSITELTKQLNSADAGLQQLQGNAESIRSLLLNFEKRVGETAANPAFITPNSTIASRANASATSTSPKAPMLAFAGGFVGLTLGSLLALLLELRDKGFRTSAQVQRQIGSLTVSATPRAVGRQRKSPADIILNDNRSAFAEAFRVSWANIQLALEGPRSAFSGGRPSGTALGITSAASHEGKSTHALALARTAALAGENVVLVDADLRRSGTSRLLDQDFCFTLRDFLEDRCTAHDVVATEERSGVHFVPSAPSNFNWMSQDLQRFHRFVDYLKDRFSIVIIDLPPIVGLAETIRLAKAADSIALVIRWGRTERQFVQFALDALRSARVSTISVILNDIDLKAQQRRGYRDHTAIYANKGLYRAEPGYREPATQTPLPRAAAKPDAHSETSVSERQPRDTHEDRPRPAGSDIERLYNTCHS